MKYGESAFDVVYLIFAIASGVFLLVRGRDRNVRMMGLASLILGCGDAFHLIPRVLNYFSDSDFTSALGIGKLVTSITMTVFYVLMYILWLSVYDEKENKVVRFSIMALTAFRIVMCLMPQNRWLTNDGSIMWGVARNIPFTCLGAIIVVLYFRKRDLVPSLRWTWLLVTLSFALYLPVAVASSLVPVLGALMMPKTVCYILIIASFLRFHKESR